MGALNAYLHQNDLIITGSVKHYSLMLLVDNRILNREQINYTYRIKLNNYYLDEVDVNQVNNLYTGIVDLSLQIYEATLHQRRLQVEEMVNYLAQKREGGLSRMGSRRN